MNPSTPSDTTLPTDDADLPVGPQPGESIQPTETPTATPIIVSDSSDMSVSDVAPEAPTPDTFSADTIGTAADPALVASDPSPLDDMSDAAEMPPALDDELDASPVVNDAADSPSIDLPDAPTDEPVPDDLSVPEPSAPDLSSGEELTPDMDTTPALDDFSTQPTSVPEPQPISVTVEQAPAASQPQPPATPPASPQPESLPPQPITAEPFAQPTPPVPAPALPDEPKLPPVVVHTGKKSKSLLIALILFVIIAASSAAAYFLVLKKDTPATTTPNTTQDNQEVAPTADTSDKTEEKPEAKEIVTAQYFSELDEVCDGKSIANATAYTTNKNAVIVTFSNTPSKEDSWTSETVGFGKSYYLGDVDEFAKTSVVACARADKATVVDGRKCTYTTTSSGEVVVDYKALKYQLSFYEAKTGKQIGDAQTIDASATECPTTVLYDMSTKIAYASPDEAALEAAQDAFVK